MKGTKQRRARTRVPRLKMHEIVERSLDWTLPENRVHPRGISATIGRGKPEVSVSITEWGASNDTKQEGVVHLAIAAPSAAGRGFAEFCDAIAISDLEHIVEALMAARARAREMGIL